MLRKKRLWLLILVCLILGGIVGYFYFSKLNECHVLSFEQGFVNYGEENIVTFEPLDGSKYYLVGLYADGTLIKEEETTEAKVVFGKLELKAGNKIKIVINAYRENGEVSRTYNSFYYQYQDPKVRPVHVYLSPSNQTDNLGVARAGYTTECEMMNLVADTVEEKLKEAGYQVFRNKPSMNLKEMFTESKKIGVNLHLALHSNAYQGTEQNEVWGTETWIYSRDSNMLSFAKLLQKRVMEIYPYSYGNRGVKYSSEQFPIGEVDPAKVTNGVLIELAFHDNYKDAKWISENTVKIGETIAKAVIEYYGS